MLEILIKFQIELTSSVLLTINFNRSVAVQSDDLERFSIFIFISPSLNVNLGSNQYCPKVNDAYGNYLSIAMAISVNTDAQILRLATNCDILQNSVPKGQFEFSMYTKLSVVFKVETIASAIDRFTVGKTRKEIIKIK